MRAERSSNARSNADGLNQTFANHLEHAGADQPKHRAGTDSFKTQRARLLIRGLPTTRHAGGNVSALPRTRRRKVSRQPEPVQGAFSVTA